MLKIWVWFRVFAANFHFNKMCSFVRKRMIRISKQRPLIFFLLFSLAFILLNDWCCLLHLIISCYLHYSFSDENHPCLSTLKNHQSPLHWKSPLFHPQRTKAKFLIFFKYFLNFSALFFVVSKKQIVIHLLSLKLLPFLLPFPPTSPSTQSLKLFNFQFSFCLFTA